MTATLCIVLMLVLLALSVPFWVVLGVGTAALLLTTDSLPLSLLGEALFDNVDSFALIAIPLFVLTGDVMVRSKLAYKLLDFAEATTGSLRSGLGTSTVMGCGFFACISGSDAADAAAIGRITMKRLVDRGYPPPYACALVAAGACTGILIPPSIAYIIIGLVLGISSSTLFLAAFIPGLLVLVSVMLTNVVLNRINGYENSRQRFSWSAWFIALNDAKYAIAVPLIILGGIYTGVFTPTESAAVAVAVALIVGLCQRTITLKDFPAMLATSARVNGVILPIIAVALLFAQALTVLDIPQQFVAALTALTTDRTLLILIMLLIFIIAGMFMETTPNLVILAPLLYPVAQQIGMDQIHFCIFMVTSLGLGFITPPMGLNLFVVASLTGQPIMTIARYAFPFVVVMVLVSALIGFVPPISLWAVR
ncbi:MAG TPA: TRAP transporter large permease [Burkholderiales bacterium]|jgi:tripartite ATP-independent transporter DctM subunit|nr:TRAP transporter large permease [Burkholderiales bacterium]